MLKIQKAIKMRKICENNETCTKCKIKKECHELKELWFDLTCYSIEDIAKQIKR